MRILVGICAVQALTHGYGSTITPAHDPEERQAQQNEAGAKERATKVAGVAPDEDDGGAGNEDGGQNGISPDAVRPHEIGPLATVIKDGGGGEHVEEPLGEDGEFEMLLKLGKEEQENGGKEALHDERGGGRLEARMNMRELAEE